MSNRGKNINLYLMDGTPNGRIKCTLANWIGVSYKIPRTELDKCKTREDLSQNGVYFLFGTSDETGEDVVYIGQADIRKSGVGILNRLQEHKRNTDKDYWAEAVVFITSNNSFGQTEISYLENRFVNLAVMANRYEIKNGNDPTSGNITEEKESELEEFIDYAKIIMGTLGHKVFDPFTEAKRSTDENKDMSVMRDELLLLLKTTNRKSGQTVEAKCKRTVEGFVVLKGSHIMARAEEDSTPPSIQERRKKAQVDEGGVLQEDTLFKSPSYAASFVVGRSANGLISWKTTEGKTLKEMEAEED